MIRTSPGATDRARALRRAALTTAQCVALMTAGMVLTALAWRVVLALL